MTMKRLISWIICLALVFSNVIAFADSESSEESGVRIISTTPENGSEGITPMGTKMEVTFNAPMDPATLTTAAITSDPVCISAVVPDAKSPAKCTIYFKAMDLDTEYKVTFSRQIKAASGERLAKTEVSFRTTAEYPKHHQIVNGDMEDTTHLNMFDLRNASTSAISYVNEDGNSVLKFTPQWSNGAPVGQDVYIEPGKTYEMRVRVKSTTSQKVSLIMSYVTVSEGSGAWHHPVDSKTPAPDTWVELSGTVTIPEDLSYDYVRQMRVTTSNIKETIYIDDMQFFEQGYDVPIPKVSAAAEKKMETYVGADVDTDLETLVGVGIFDESVLDKKDSPISRLDAAVALGKFMNAPSTATGEIKYKDLAGVKNGGIVNTLAEMEIISGYGKSFYPDNNISYNDVAKALVKILGYESLLGGKGYTAVALELGLFDGISSTSRAMTYSDFAKIIINTEDADVMVKNGSGEYTASDRKAMDLFMGIRKGKGIVSATEFSDLYGTNRADNGNIIIDREQYKVTCDTYGWEGKLIDYYYKLEGGEKTIVSVGGLNALNRCITIEYKDVVGYARSKLTYYNSSNRKKTANIATNKKLIYNGKALGSYSNLEDLLPDYGTVQLIENNNDGDYDIIRIEDIVTYVVHAIDYDDYKIYDEYDATLEPLDLGFCDKLIVEENGAVSKFENITVGSVVSAVVSEDKSVAKLYVSKNSLEGLVGKIAGRSSEITMSIYDEIHREGVSETFKVHPLYKGAEKARTDAGSFLNMNAVISFDYRGYVVAVELQVGSGWKWAYLVKALRVDEDLKAVPAEKWEEEGIIFKIFSEDNKHLKSSAAKVVRINGSLKKGEDIFTALGSDTAQMLRIQYNSKGEISEIVTVGSSENTMDKFEINDTYHAGLKSLGYKVGLSSTSIPLFVVPSNPVGAEEYEFDCSTVSSYLKDTKKYAVEAYSVDDNDLNVECIVMKDRVVKTPTTWTTGVIEQITIELDDNDEIYKKLAIQNSSSKYTAKVYDGRVDLDNLEGVSTGTGLQAEVGDIVIYQNDAQGMVVNMRLLYKADRTGNPTATGTWYTDNNPDTYGGSDNNTTNGYRFVAGKIAENKDGYIKLLPHGKEAEAANYEVFNTGVFSTILSVDDEGRKAVTAAKLADIYNKLCGSEDVNVVIVSAWGGATLMAIYQ